MDSLNQFIDYLATKEKASRSTVKNYKADLNQFLKWLKNISDESKIDLDLVNTRLIDVYKSSKKISNRSFKRHLSSIKGFFSYLESEAILKNNPFKESIRNRDENDLYHLSEFKTHLFNQNTSYLTIKNYLIDIKQFLGWFEKIACLEYVWDIKDRSILNKLSLSILEEYKVRLVKTGFSPTSVNRKLSSLRRYIRWAKETGLIQDTELGIKNLEASKKFNFDLIAKHNTAPLSETEKKEIKTNYSRIPPVRLFQKGMCAINMLFDTVFIFPLAKVANFIEEVVSELKEKPLFLKPREFVKAQNKDYEKEIPKHQEDGVLKNIPKSFYAPLDISTKYFSWHKLLFHNIRYKRPKWYKQYHSHAISHYFHFSVLIIYASALGFGLYQNFIVEPSQKKPVLAASSPSRVLSFQGRITDSSGNPIAAKKLVRFQIYDDLISTGSGHLKWQEVNTITPDSDGFFNTLLGKTSTNCSNPIDSASNGCKIPQSLFADNPTLYLGVAVEDNPELSPRQQIATVAYATNAELLQGMAPTTDSSVTGNTNVILALNSTGTLAIGGTSTTTFQATGGQFKILGKSLRLETNSGTSGNIELVPDGLGKIDLQKPLANTSNFGNFVSGAVEVNDNFAVIATTSARAAFIVNNNAAGGAIMAASSSGSIKFIIDSNGSVGIGNSVPTEKLDISGNATMSGNLTFTGSTSTISNTSSNPLVIGSSTTGKITIDSGTSQITLSDPTTFSSTINLPNSNTLTGISNYLNFSQGIGFGSTTGTPTYYINSSGTGNLNGATFAGLVTANLGLTIDRETSTTTDAMLTVTSDVSTNENVVFKVLANGDFTYDGTGSSPASDVAELYKSRENLEPGDVVSLDSEDIETGSISKSKQASDVNLFGIISTKPGLQLGYDKSTSEDIKLYPVALTGRVPTKVSTENGIIRKGDLLTSSSTPGVAMKATRPGITIGKTLEDYNGESKATILVFVNLSWFDPEIYLADSGNLVSSSMYHVSSIINQESSSPILNTSYLIQDTAGQLVQRIGAFSELVAARIKAGLIEAENVIVNNFLIAKNISTQTLSVTSDSVNIAGKSLKEFIVETVDESGVLKNELNSPIARSEQISTDIISPLVSNSVSINGKLVIKSPSDGIATSSANAGTRNDVVLEVQGSARFAGDIESRRASISGELIADRLQTTAVDSRQLTVDGEASISGTLRANKIIANSIEGLDERIASVAASTPKTISEQVQSTSSEVLSSKHNVSSINNTDIPPSSILNTSYIIPDTGFPNISTLSAQLAYVENLNSDFARFNKGLISFGPTSLAEVSVANQLYVGENLILADNTINVLGGTLELQPLKQGNLSIMAGLVSINTDGNLVAQSAEFAKDVTVKGVLAANVISPLPDSDLVIKLASSNQRLASSSGISNSSFLIHNSSDSAVLSIDQEGNITGSGSANFTDILAKTFNIVRSAQADTSLTETIASASAGTATIITGETQRTIFSPFVSEKSLIYTTATSDTQGVMPYLARQVAQNKEQGVKGSFTIEIQKKVYKDITLNWWIVN